jgi:hypothetical protein
MDWGHDELAHDPRWLYGIPPKSEPELAWAQAALARLRPGGLAVMLMPPALASRPTGRRIRGEMVRRGVIRAIIGLPAGAVRPQNVAAHLWIMERPSGLASGDPRVLFADAAQFSADISDQADTSDQDEGWVQLTERVLNAWLGFQRGASDSNDSQRDVAGYGTVVRAIDLLDDDVDLSPARHDVPRRDQKDPAETTVLLKSLRRALGEILHETAEDLPEAAWPAAGNHGAGSRSTGTRVDRARVDSGTGPETGWRMVTVADLERTRTVAIQRATTKTGTTRMEEGDVIIPALGANAPVRGHVVTREEAGTEVPPNTHLVRPNHGHIDPWFLAGFLVAPASVRAAAYGTNGGRIEVRRLTVPFLPLPEQQAYGAAFRRLENSEARTREIARVTAELTELVRTGLRDRTILPG